MIERLRRRIARSIVIDRAPTAGDSFITRTAKRRTEANYAFAAPYVAGKTVLDVGGGLGNGHELLLKAGAAHVTSIDPYPMPPKHLADARLTYLTQDFLANSFPDESFDVVLCFGVLFYLKDQEKGLAEMRRVLKPRGTLLINCINAYMIERYFGMPLTAIDAKFAPAYDFAGLRALVKRYFDAESECYLQQPVRMGRGIGAFVRFWTAPFRWPFMDHPILPRSDSAEGMFNYFVLRKAP